MKNMSKRKRLEAAIAGEPVDRLPVALWRHWPGDDQDAAALAAAHLKWQADYDWDLVKVGPASSYSVVDWGLQDRWLGHIEGTRETTQRPVSSPADWETLRPLDPTQGMLAEQIKALRLVGEGLRGQAPFIATIFSPLSMAKHLAGNEAVLTHLRHSPDALHRGLATMTESILRFIDAARATGIDGIYYAVQHAAYPLLSRDEFDAFGRAYDQRVLASVADLWCADLWCNVVHLHGKSVMFDKVADYPMAFLNWHDRDTGISLAEGLAHMRPAASGGVSQWTLHQEGPAAALNEIQDARAQTGDRRLLLGTGCVIMTTTPLRNIRALREAV